MHLLHPSCLSTLLSLFLLDSTSISAQIATPEFDGGLALPNRNTSQSASGFSASVSGRIVASPSSGLHQLSIQLFETSGRRIVAETNPNLFGSFELPAAPNGLYELRVVGMHGDLIHSRLISLPYANTIEIHLNPVERGSGSSHPASLARIQHKIPKKAQKEFSEAQEASRKGRQQIAIAHLENALAIDPLFFESLNNLGVHLARLGKFEQACELFTRATAIDPSDALAEMNLAFTLLKLGRVDQAEQAARASLRSDPLSPRARFYLAISLLEQNKANTEALFHLAKVADQFEPAKQLLERLKRK